LYDKTFSMTYYLLSYLVIILAVEEQQHIFLQEIPCLLMG
jgi:hypothetical protein